MAGLAQIDDALINGQTYTFVFQGTSVTQAVLQKAVADYAPSFLENVNVTIQQSGASGSVYYVQFAYEGDGSDKVSDVANSLLAAFLQETAWTASMDFVQAVTGAASNIALPPPNAAGVSYWSTS